VCQGDSRPTQKVHSNHKSASGGQGLKEIPYIHKKLPERNRGVGRNILIQVLPACRRPSTLARCAASGGRGPGGRNLMDHCDLCDLCYENPPHLPLPHTQGVPGGEGRGGGGFSSVVVTVD